MSKILLLMLLVLTTLLGACSKDNNGDNGSNTDLEKGVIIITTKNSIEYLSINTPNIKDKITIDWGDGNVEELYNTKHEDNGDVYHEIQTTHTYSDNKMYKIQIGGKISVLDCNENQIVTLDISNCIELTELYCGLNQLTSLNINACGSLIMLDCAGNELSAPAMNKTYNDLPKVSKGELVCDKIGDYTIAEGKGWKVYAN